MYALGNYNAPSTNFTAKTLILWISSVALSYSITIGTPETYTHRKTKKTYMCYTPIKNLYCQFDYKITYTHHHFFLLLIHKSFASESNI